MVTNAAKMNSLTSITRLVFLLTLATASELFLRCNRGTIFVLLYINFQIWDSNVRWTTALSRIPTTAKDSSYARMESLNELFVLMVSILT